MTLRWTEEQIEAHQRKVHGNNKNCRASSVANVEQRSGNEAEGQDAAEKALPPVVIRFTHYRRKPADPDNFATKWFVDALVENGVLRNDTPKEVKEVRHRQVIIEQWEEERTVIELIDAMLVRDEQREAGL